MADEVTVGKEVLLGARFFRYVDEKLNVLKIIGMKNQATARIIWLVKDGKEVIRGGKVTYNMQRAVLDEDYIMLSPDCYILFTIVNIWPDKSKEDMVNDVIISMHPSRSADPYVVCRQNIVNIYHTAIDYNIMEVGMCMSKETVPEGFDFKAMTGCDGVIKSIPVVGYMDDNLEDILRCIKGHYMTEMNNCLISLKENYVNKFLSGEEATEAMAAKIYKGYCTSIKDLLVNTDFMYDYERAFRVTRFDDITIRCLDPSLDQDEDLFTIDENIVKGLSKAYSIEFYNMKFLRYSKQIEFGKIRRSKILIKDSTGKIYIGIYDNKESTESALPVAEQLGSVLFKK